jgi:uncharacterized protein
MTMNKVVHFEIPYDDRERAGKFYEGVFGWQLKDVPNMNYTMARTSEVDEDNMPKEKGVINGGLWKREGVGAPIVVIDVPSIDDHLQKIEQAGGKVVMPKAVVGEMGYYARVSDTEGNVIGIWENLKKDK